MKFEHAMQYYRAGKSIQRDAWKREPAGSDGIGGHSLSMSEEALYNPPNLTMLDLVTEDWQVANKTDDYFFIERQQFKGGNVEL